MRFGYPGADRDVLHGLDLTIPAGRSLAIVGLNGAGKTTLVKLLARLYEPQEGRITVDGIDVRDFPAAAWRRRLGAIFQDFVRYDLPVVDNVGFGAPELAGDEELVRKVLASAGAKEVVDALPHGLHTTLSREYADGAELSGGQWQRVAIARALMAVEGGASVLLLDEPTANLDVRAEATFFDRFLEQTRGLTTILISHRFSTVRHAERIVVLEEGAGRGPRPAGGDDGSVRRRERRRQDHARQAPVWLLRADDGAHRGRRRRPGTASGGRVAGPGRRRLPGLRAVRARRTRERRRR